MISKNLNNIHKYKELNSQHNILVHKKSVQETNFIFES